MVIYIITEKTETNFIYVNTVCILYSLIFTCMDKMTNGIGMSTIIADHMSNIINTFKHTHYINIPI